MKPMINSKLVQALALAGISSFANLAMATDGDLDTLFGVNGFITTDVGEFDSIRDLAVQSDGKIVAIGVSYIYYDQPEKQVNDFIVARYQPNGALDSCFGINGGVNFQDLLGSTDIVGEVKIQPDGKILVAGYTQPNNNYHNYDIALVRFLANGQLDSSFGNNGVVVHDIIYPEGYGNSSKLESMVIDIQGRIVVAGQTFYGPGNFLIARFLPNGSIDTSFGSNGFSNIMLAGHFKSMAVSLVADSLGGYVMGGKSHNGSYSSGPNNNDGILLRVDGNGNLDPSFGTNGFVSIDKAGLEDAVTSLVVQPDGKLVAAVASGTSYPDFIFAQIANYGSSYFPASTPYFTGNFTLMRFMPNGAPDASFGNQGMVETKIGDNSIGVKLLQQQDGKLMLAGATFDDVLGIPYDSSIAVARYLADGALDTSFGENGIRVTDFDYSVDGIIAGAMQPDNNLVLGGVSSDITTAGDFLLTRFLSNGNSPATSSVDPSCEGLMNATAVDGSVPSGSSDENDSASGSVDSTDSATSSDSSSGTSSSNSGSGTQNGVVQTGSGSGDGTSGGGGSIGMMSLIALLLTGFLSSMARKIRLRPLVSQSTNQNL